MLIVSGLEETLPDCLQHIVLYNVSFFILIRLFFSFPVFCALSKHFYCDIPHLYNIVIPIIKLIQ